MRILLGLLSLLLLAGCAEPEEKTTWMERMQVELRMFKDTSVQEALAQADDKWTLETVLADPKGVRGEWVAITGTTFTDPDDPREDGFWLGRIDEAAGIYQVVMVNTDPPDPPMGTRVRVLGYVVAAGPPVDEDLEGAMREYYSEWAIVILMAKEVVVLD